MRERPEREGFEANIYTTRLSIESCWSVLDSSLCKTYLCEKTRRPLLRISVFGLLIHFAVKINCISFETFEIAVRIV